MILDIQFLKLQHFNWLFAIWSVAAPDKPKWKLHIPAKPSAVCPHKLNVIGFHVRRPFHVRIGSLVASGADMSPCPLGAT